jgi:magnesium chelatase family protein
MLSQVTSCAVLGLNGVRVEVQVDVANGLPTFLVVGLPDAAVNESRERVRAAVKNSGLAFPMSRITVNLAPGDLRKEGPAYDLPIAVGVLQATQQLGADLSDAMIIGELSLDGGVRHTNGVLSMAMLAQAEGLKRLFVPAADAPEAALIPGMEVYPIETLFALYAHLQGMQPIKAFQVSLAFNADDVPPYGCDFQEVRGQEHVKRALEIAAAGFHNLIMTGPPSVSKLHPAPGIPLAAQSPTRVLCVSPSLHSLRLQPRVA